MLEVERVGLEDGGTYVCTAETDTNTVHKTVQVMRNTAIREQVKRFPALVSNNV